MFKITPSLFLFDGKENVKLVDHQINYLLEKVKL